VSTSASVPVSALVIAHPGHELRAFGWASEVRPITFVLTKGDGHDGQPRVSSTSRVLKDAGASEGTIFGRFGDREIYDVFLNQRYGVIDALCDELAAAFVQAGITLVVCDAAEGYNPSHDVCRYLTVAAARRASRLAGRPIEVFDFPLVGPPDECAGPLRAACIRLQLTEETFTAKLAHARRYEELRYEVDRAIAANGAAAFRVEWLRPATAVGTRWSEPPFYEQHGLRQVDAGHYSNVIRFDPHILGFLDVLERGSELP